MSRHERPAHTSDPHNDLVQRRVKVLFDHLIDKNNQSVTLANLHFKNNVGISGGLNIAINTKQFKAHLYKKYFDVLRFYTQKYLPQGLKNQIGYMLLKRKLVKTNHLNMIETLIVISIIVAFSGLTGAVLLRKFEESRVMKVKIEVPKIMEALMMYYSRNNRYPLDLDELTENGDLIRVPKDPWNTVYVYVPQVDWARLVRVLTSGGAPDSQQLNFYTESIKRLRSVLVTAPKNVDILALLLQSNDQPFVFSAGNKEATFGDDFDMSTPKNKIQNVRTLMKQALERSTQYPELNEAIKDIGNLLREN